MRFKEGDEFKKKNVILVFKRTGTGVTGDGWEGVRNGKSEIFTVVVCANAFSLAARVKIPSYKRV